MRGRWVTWFRSGRDRLVKRIMNLRLKLILNSARCGVIRLPTPC